VNIAVAGLLSLVAMGLCIEVPSPRLRWVAISAFAAVSVVGLALMAYPTTPAPVGPGSPVVKTQVPVQAGAALGRFYVLVESCAVDTAGDTWVEVRFQNAGPDPVEWSQTVEVRQEGVPVDRSDYGRSTRSRWPSRPADLYGLAVRA
jgi:hypothetical protein